MRYIEMGTRQVSVVGLGAWQFGTQEWGYGSEFGRVDVEAIILRALDLGVNLIDTAEVYADGRSEELIGEAVRDQRDRVFLATKVAQPKADQAKVIRAASGSLRRLQMETIDLYQVHSHDPSTPQEHTMAGMRELRSEGLIAQVGVSNYSRKQWQEAEEALGGPIVANQVEYSLLDRRPEAELLPFAQDAGRVIIAYSPLAKGLLSGRYDEDNLPGGVRVGDPTFARDNVRKALPLIEELRVVAAARRVTPAQVAMAWLLSASKVVVIPGAKSVAQMEQNAAAADILLTNDEWSRLDVLSRPFL
ncbi:MAG: putative oxidoreductase [Chloroflexi bacterium]|jgi:aryl-alcohol dehydrogenase-like predicted oxidoreductase|nr:MAG: putative oxidoreductase [Chloroflexota bacterium]